MVEPVIVEAAENGLILERCGTGSALLSVDRRYRYRLTRPLAGVGPAVLWIMLNPSTADASVDDATVRQCLFFSRRLGASTLTVVNLFAFRATHPKELLRTADPTGPENRRILEEAVQEAATAVAAWGALSAGLWRVARLDIGIVKRSGGLKCLGKTKTGAPCHPVRLAHDTAFEPWP